MKIFHFKTTIKCAACVATVTPALDNMPEVSSWHVDLVNPDRVLTITAADDAAGKVVDALQKTGYTAELLP